jgi:hypothetical protein
LENHWQGAKIMIRKIRSLALAGMLGIGAVLGTGSFAAAYEPPACNYYYKTVVCYENQVVTYDVCVTRYDYCGRPYEVHETHYRTVQVPVVKRILVRG